MQRCLVFDLQRRWCMINDIEGLGHSSDVLFVGICVAHMKGVNGKSGAPFIVWISEYSGERSEAAIQVHQESRATAMHACASIQHISTPNQ